MSSSWTKVSSKNRNNRRPRKSHEQNEQHLNCNHNVVTDGIVQNNFAENAIIGQTLPDVQPHAVLKEEQVQAGSSKKEEAKLNECKPNDGNVQNLTIKSMNNTKSIESVTEKAKNGWTKVVKIQKNLTAQGKIHYISLPNNGDTSFADSEVLKNIVGTKFTLQVAEALRALLARNKITLEIVQTGIVQHDTEFTIAMPLLEEHQKILPFIWNNINAGDIITGGRTNRALALNSKDTVYTLEKKIIFEKEIYTLNFERDESAKLTDLHCKVYATLTEDIHGTPYSTYSYGTKKISGKTIHFLSEEDAYEEKKKEFYEIKIYFKIVKL
uniref:Uncharacterized protein n=1 Tax=Panagrolaimus superbus TaxID=310955 RepID=A0A914Y6J8_9BILA